MREAPSTRIAVTLIELLVVIGIIGVILGMALPAIQRVRDAAARAECANNIRQLGLAAHQFHNVYRSFPPGLAYDSTQFGRTEYLSWLGFLLPYVEQEAIWNQSVTAYKKDPVYWHDPPHPSGTPVPAFACPADSRVLQAHSLGFPLWVASTSYLGVMGQDLFTLNGVFYEDSYIGIKDIKDGTSQTLLAGERPPPPDFVRGRWYADSGQLFTGSTGNIMGVREKNVQRVTVGSCPPGYYDFAPGHLWDPCDRFHFWSLHDGGANFLFADGSVRFLDYGVAPLLPALASRAGRETTEVP